MPSVDMHPVAQWVSEVTGAQNPFEMTLPTGEVVMPTPGLQDADDDYVSVSELLPVHYINLEDDSADVSADALEDEAFEEDDFEASERAFEDSIAKGSAARDGAAAAAQNDAAEGWKGASMSLRDAQKALQAAEQSYKKLQRDFAGQAKRTVET